MKKPKLIEYIEMPLSLKNKYQDYTCAKKEWGDNQFITVEHYLTDGILYYG